MKKDLVAVRKSLPDGLYRPEFEHDACGTGFVCNTKNVRSHQIIIDGAQILNNLVHRGAVGANPTTGDGAGMLLQIPDRLFRSECKKLGFELPPLGSYGVGMLMLPQSDKLREKAEELLANCLCREKLQILGWRDVPCDNSHLNDEVRGSEPCMRQVFISGSPKLEQEEMETSLYIVRRLFEHEAKQESFDNDPAGIYVVSISTRTVVYKGMFLADQLMPYYSDLTNPICDSALSLVHQRFSTNTFPAWSLAHPYRAIAHNGEINTVRGNINNMLARQHSIYSERFGDKLAKTFPLLDEGLSDSGTFDNAFELLLCGGYSPAQAMLMMIPEAWQGNKDMDPVRRAFYKHHAVIMEPWDGPALVAFTNGNQIGAMLDRNGLRPARYTLTKDDRLVMASESGVLPIAEEDIVRKWRLEPGKILLIDLVEQKIIDDNELKEQLANAKPFRNWNKESQIHIDSLPEVIGEPDEDIKNGKLLQQQVAFGYTKEDLKFILEPMARNGEEPIGSMGDDAPVAILSNRPQQLSAYFRQEFAQVTNPPIDPIREAMVMSTNTYLGVRPNLLALNSKPEHKVLSLDSPILSEAEFAQILNVGQLTDSQIVSRVIDLTYPTNDDPKALEEAIQSVCDLAEDQANSTAISILILSDRALDADRMTIPAILAVSAVHHRLVDTGDRTKIGLVADTGFAKEVHDFAVLAGYGCEAICPYLAYKSIVALDVPKKKITTEARLENYRKAINKGLRKVMSKMGVSTYQSFCGAQLFEIIGFDREFCDKYFCRSITQIDGIGIKEITKECYTWHRQAYQAHHDLQQLDCGGTYATRTRGEHHMWSFESISYLQNSVRTNSYDSYKQYAAQINEQGRKLMTLRGMLQTVATSKSIDIEEVEPVTAIVKRFSTGAMSFGSISIEAHTTLAIAMNRLGGKSNTGEGGEDVIRFKPLENGDSMRSAIKQVASGRFGVTAEYLVNSDMMQIKIAQGAKPGEGGQLPGHKVDKEIAKVRHSVPGVGLISPPPHHDIYSIEDIAQLIYDLKNVNPSGDVSVKLVSRYGVGTVAAGVAKAKSDHITIAGHDGGTGASPLSSVKHAGTPWELGLAETNQTLVLNNLRSRVALQVDGQIKTGRDVVIGALLGADEFGFATAPLVAQGCLMIRKCHLNTCPVGIATQDPELRKKFVGKPEHIVNYFFFVAEEVRREMASMGIRKFDDMIGRTDLIEFVKPKHWKAQHINLAALLKRPVAPAEYGRYHSQKQDHGIEQAMDSKLLPKLKKAIQGEEKIELECEITNANRSIGTIISGKIAKLHGHKGLSPDSIVLRMKGSAGQSFGGFLASGVTLELIGDTNDYCGKGISGGVISVKQPDVGRSDDDNVIAGNTCLYGAISGECYLRGVVGERFAVRNSGASAVVEGAGDHCCEYMTGGTVIVLGSVGRNFAAGMSGGVAYVLDLAGNFEQRCNQAEVTLEALSSETATDSHLGRPDTDILRDLLRRHYQLTRSPKASEILKDWNTYVAKFVKVMPKEYRRVFNSLNTVKEVA